MYPWILGRLYSALSVSIIVVAKAEFQRCCSPGWILTDTEPRHSQPALSPCELISTRPSILGERLTVMQVPCSPAQSELSQAGLSSLSVGQFLSSSSSSSSLNLSSSPTANIVSPSSDSLGNGVGFVGIGAGSGDASLCALLEPPRGASYGGGGLLLSLPIASRSSSMSIESRMEAISKPSSSCAICRIESAIDFRI